MTTAEVLLPLPIVIPLLAAALGLVLTGRLRLQRALALAAVSGSLVASTILLVRTADAGTIATQVGGWPAPYGITLVSDRFAAIMLVVAVAMVLAVLVFAVGQLGDAHERASFHPLYLVLCAGVSAAFLTGDLFNLFVSFEVMLSASYVLLVLGGTRAQVRAGMTYVVVSLLASTLFVVAVALVYAATGTVNLAELALRSAELDPALRQALVGLLLVVFGVKAAIFPLFFWLPDSYPTAPSPVTAVFAGLLTKVGVYAIIRSQTLLGATDGPSALLLGIAAATMVVGVLGAVVQDDVKRILSFHIVSQIGYMIFGVGLFTLAGLAGAILYIIHHIVVKTALFLVSGLLERRTGTARLQDLTGLARRTPVLGVLFALPALSLAGVPPFSGFVAKLALVQAGLAAGQGALVAVSLAVSVLTVFSMAKIWSGAFWGDEASGEAEPIPLAPRTMTFATASLVGLSIAVALGAGPLSVFTRAAAGDLLAREPYVTAVLGSPSDRLAAEAPP